MKALIHIFTLFSFIFIISCDSSTISNTDDVIFPDPATSTISYQNHVYPFFKVKCATAGCHGDIEPAGGRRMTTYYYITNPIENPGLIVFGDPDGSIVIQMMEKRLPHTPLFPDSYFTENQIKGLRAWIENGANDN